MMNRLPAEIKKKQVNLFCFLEVIDFREKNYVGGIVFYKQQSQVKTDSLVIHYSGIVQCV